MYESNQEMNHNDSTDELQKYVHYITGRYNLTKFEKDNKDNYYDKICLITIGKGEVLPNLVGRYS